MGKIDLSKLKDILNGAAKGLGSLKPYAALLWPALIIFVSVLVMTTALMMGRSFRQKVTKESVPIAKEIKSMLDKTVPQQQVEIERQYQKDYEQDANRITRLAKESTQRELLNYDIFSSPNDVAISLFTKFGDAFRRNIDELVTKVNGKDCPSKEELEKSAIQNTGNDQEIIFNEICQARANATSVYVNPANISGYIFWEKYKFVNKNEAIKDSWSWQLGYWIIEDVFSTVASMNSGSENVRNSPVKRILRIGFSTADTLFVADAEIPQTNPKYVLKTEDQLTESYSARMCDDNIDVVHFGVSVIVSAKDVMSFMKELCSIKEHLFFGYPAGKDNVSVFKHNQISILESQIRPVELNSNEHQNCRYGDESVVEVDLICEYIFDKKGYKDVKPSIFESKGTESQEPAA